MASAFLMLTAELSARRVNVAAERSPNRCCNPVLFQMLLKIRNRLPKARLERTFLNMVQRDQVDVTRQPSQKPDQTVAVFSRVIHSFYHSIFE